VLPLTIWENLILLPQFSQRKLSLLFLFCCSSTTRLREVLSIAAWWSFSISFCSSTLFDRADFKLALCSNSWMSDSILLLYIIVYITITIIEDYSIHEFIPVSSLKRKTEDRIYIKNWSSLRARWVSSTSSWCKDLECSLARSISTKSFLHEKQW
jgi:hypothetical protein